MEQAITATALATTLDCLRPIGLVRVPAFPSYGDMPDSPTHTRMDAAEQAALVAAVAVSQDRDAFAHLFRHFAPRVKAYLLRLGADDSNAEALTQEAMVSLWRKAATFDASRASVATWVFTIARNKRIDALRREHHAQIDPDDPLLTPEPEAAADEQLHTAQQEERIRAALSTLSEDQAEVIRMAFFEDKSHSVIAAETSLPLGTVKSRLRLTLKHLRGALQGERLP